jgi:hypothetical protein
MDERPFVDPGRQPTDDAVSAVLGAARPSWTRLLGLAGPFATEWSHSARGGWMLKVADRKKALLYLVPLRDAFRVSLTVREAEREAFLADADLAPVHDRIREATRYTEGYALYFEVSGGADIGPLETLIGELVAVRSAGN